jgi:RimJ/RimL family protein N-acetyltransferase
MAYFLHFWWFIVIVKRAKSIKNSNFLRRLFMSKIEVFSVNGIKARRLTPGDLDELTTLYQTPEVTKTLGGTRSREQVIELLDWHLQHWDQYGFGYYVFEEKNSGSLIGRGGLQYCQIDGRKEVEIAYAFMPEYWGKGIATRIVQKLIELGFHELQLNTIVGFTLPENKASRRVLEKNGFIFEKEVVHKGLPHVLYRLTTKVA